MNPPILALMNPSTAPRPHRSWSRLGAPSVPVLLLVLLPKCPMCLGAYLGFLAWLGWSSRTLAATVTGVLALVGALLVTRWASAAWKRGARLPLALGLAGFATVVAGRFFESPAPFLWLGALVFGCGSLAAALLPPGARACCHVRSVSSHVRRTSTGPEWSSFPRPLSKSEPCQPAP
ncbi:MAG: hypothetical protein JNL97_15620 [Verrucomicrobiales bacterium]|nr:hypothetical protein [Verrucomicrobiales bacterium]